MNDLYFVDSICAAKLKLASPDIAVAHLKPPYRQFLCQKISAFTTTSTSAPLCFSASEAIDSVTETGGKSHTSTVKEKYLN